jgi:hypothetical protein
MSSRSIRSSSSIPSGGRDLGDPRSREGFGDGVELLAHHLVEADAVAEDLEQFADRCGELLELAADLVAAERGQAVEAQLEDGPDLGFGEPVAVALDLGSTASTRAM